MPQNTQNSRQIHAAPEELYRAITTPSAIEGWQVPGNMTGKIHRFDLKEGGGYEMSLFYSPDEDRMTGKTNEREDRFTARFVELDPPRKIVQAIEFASDDPQFAGEMTMIVTLEPKAGGTHVTFRFENLPPGIRPEDNEAGTQSSLQKLAKYVE